MWFTKSTKGYLWPHRKKRLKETIDKDIDGYIKSKDESSSVNGEDRKAFQKILTDNNNLTNQARSPLPASGGG